MSLAREVGSELCGMFLADARLSVSIVVLVLIVAALAVWLPPLLAGGVLILGCLSILVSTAALEAREGLRR